MDEFLLSSAAPTLLSNPTAMDIKTMLFALALGNLTLCAALFFHHSGRGGPAGAAAWAAGRQLQGVGWLLLFFRASGVLPDLAAIPAGYALLFAGLGCEAVALREAAGRPGRRRATAAVLGVVLLAFFASWLLDEAGLRQVLGTVVMAVLYLAIAAAFAHGWSTAGALRRFLAVSGALLAVLVAARAVMVMTTPEGWGWLSSPALQMLASAAFYLLMLVGAFGYLLLERERAQDELARLAVQDPLTGVPNRRGFFAALAPWLSLARRPGQPTALMVIDIDLLKRINDGYGHPAGDTVLRAIVDTCTLHLRDSDQLGRLGGAEFAVLLPRTGMPEALVVAERIRAAVQAAPVKTERALVNMTVSVGVTTLRPDDTNVSLFKRAGEALAAAKRAGRNQVVQAPATPVAMQA